ncbi:hypothetical protein SAMN05421639_104375 [Chryseobacterium shigense]|uniref:Uncharacterized protein n=1 Tax=Chryseobacterium shigense TaxID=297244 RepID=A0A1N7IQ38_9FLAO|nr:hypothetical protein SAMN05421639_104375 [Chryseobacterium shigense]
MEETAVLKTVLPDLTDLDRITQNHVMILMLCLNAVNYG